MERIPRTVLFGNPEKAAPQISPDGTKLAYLAPHNGVLNVWVRTLGQTDDHVVTDDQKRGIRRYFWQPDGAHIVYLQDQDGDENWHVYQSDVETRNTRDLTPYEGVQARIVAVDPNVPDQILVAVNNRTPQFHDVYRVDLRTGNAEPDTQNPGDVANWSADNALQVRAAQVVLPDGGTEIRVREEAEAPWRTFQTWGPDESFGGIAGFTPDNASAWLISSVDANAARLLEANLSTGEMTVVVEDPQYDVHNILVHPTRRTLEAVEFVRARSEWQLIDQSLQADFDV